MPIRVLLVDDHALLRQGLRRLLDNEPEISVVGEAGSADEAEQLTETIMPEVILMDLQMAGRSGAEAADTILRAHPEIGIIILTMHDSDEHLQKALDSGVRGYLLKTAGIGEVVNAVKAVHEGKSVIDPSMTAQMLVQYRKLSQKGPANDSTALTVREVEVLTLLSKGLSNKEIATSLSYSESTVKNRLSIIFDKMGVQDRTQAVIQAMKIGVLKLDAPQQTR